MDAIPREVALQLCAEIRQGDRAKWYSFARLQCWGCTTFAKGNPDKMCLSSQEGYRGCSLINKRYAQRSKVKVGQAN
jgi:hypothetical protein